MPNDISDLRDGARHLRDASRILVIGSSGGGKSTLSRQICDGLNLPYISMDRDFLWLPGWVKRDKQEERRLIAEAVKGERWVMDGSGASTFDLRLPRADLVLWVRVSRWICLLGIAKRVLRYRGTTRPDMAPGCIEGFPDREFLSYIWHFERRWVPGILRNLDLHGPDVPVLQLKSRRDMRKLLDLAGLSA